MKIQARRFIKEKLEEIKKDVGDSGALVATSGGVDSMTCALLAHKALGKRAVILFIDDGLMRDSDEKRVRQELKPFGIKVKTLNAQKEFFKELKGKEDPEEKRKAFRQLFYKTLGKAVKQNKVKSLKDGSLSPFLVIIIFRKYLQNALLQYLASRNDAGRTRTY